MPNRGGGCRELGERRSLPSTNAGHDTKSFRTSGRDTTLMTAAALVRRDALMSIVIVGCCGKCSAAVDAESRVLSVNLCAERFEVPVQRLRG